MCASGENYTNYYIIIISGSSSSSSILQYLMSNGIKTYETQSQANLFWKLSTINTNILRAFNFTLKMAKFLKNSLFFTDLKTKEVWKLP